MIKLLKYMKSYKKEFVLGPAFKLFEALLELLVPLVMAGIIDYGIGEGKNSYIYGMSGLLVAIGVIGLTAAVTAQYFAAKASVGFAAKIRHALVAHIGKLSYSEIDKTGTSTLITRITSDVNQVQTGVNLTLRLVLRSPFVVFGAMIMAIIVNPGAGMIFAGVIGVLCIVVFGFMLVTLPMHKNVQAKLDSVMSKTRENLSGVRVLRAFCLEEEEAEDFIRRNGILEKAQKTVGNISAVMNPLTYVIINLAVVVLLKKGGADVNSGVISTGDMVALYNYMSQILVELVKMAMFIITLTKAFASANRIQGVLETEIEEREGTPLSDDGLVRGAVRFYNVCLSYENGGGEVLSGIDFEARPGQTIGIIGGTGSGKTSLINLIPAFYKPTRGTVYVNGTDVLKADKADLRKRIGIVPQKAMLFKGTLRENLLWGNADATDEEIHEALCIAQAADITESKPEGLDYQLEQGGKNLSGGQRQRITIARAVVKKPEILILDDSASALDYVTDANLRSALKNMENAPTTFIVSQRASSVRFADEIIVLDDGTIAGKGTHDFLLKNCDIYREIYETQFNEEDEV